MIPWPAVAAIYGLLGAMAGLGGYYWFESPGIHPAPWLELPPLEAHVYSAVLGGTFGLLTVVASRSLIRRSALVRLLSSELRPLAQGLPGVAIVTLAVLSAVGEELLFRGLLQPATNWFVQAIVFGLVHQLPGRARWIWVAWATIMGFALGALYALTGSLVGPILAHAIVNGMNLRLLQAHDAAPSRRGLGGILGSLHP
ncbi:MAG TPA: CPBP family intramembrane glutamic endopeptidase [Polyangiaceae bacterium]|nr:CPBP family intramembrane glutamic endopeptidase [Polyangiaceae bacterium]